MKKTELSAVAPYLSVLGKRLDQVLVILFKEYSRSFLKHLILINHVIVNKKIVNKPNKKILGGEVIIINPLIKDILINYPENIFLNVIYEDNHILVINKPSGLIVHPGAGNERGTILNALLYRYKNIENLPRAGIVHRLDKDTSGLMVIAKNIFSYYFLSKLLQKRKIIRKYQGFVKGNMISGGTINAPIMRHHVKRICMMVHPLGKKSITHYKIINRFKFYTHIEVTLETGRTHQIRVHMQHIRFPLIGDPLYRNINYNMHGLKEQHANIIHQFHRQALHASHLSFFHPVTQALMSWTIPLPKDMQDLLLYF